jgi:hypothetical protein
LTWLLPSLPSHYPPVHKSSCPICYLLTWLLSIFFFPLPLTFFFEILSHQIWVPFSCFFWDYSSYLLRLQSLFLSITSQQYLPYQGHSYLIKKKESLYQCCLDITFSKDKFRPVLQKLELKDPSGLDSRILSTTEYLSNQSSRYHNNC